mmetsp:Transcript_6498/g.16802  ORF Transcript_6498/g.16802 Transcript_6498/m.16802 type:complete len:228 (-) Transcript_6498:480-1163(-)
MQRWARLHRRATTKQRLLRLRLSLLQHLVNRTRALPAARRPKASVADELLHGIIHRKYVAPACELEVVEVVEVWEASYNVGHRHEAPDQVRHMILGVITRVDGLKVTLHRVDARGHLEPLAQPRCGVAPLEGAQLIVNPETLQRHRRQQIDAAALDQKLAEGRLKLRVVLLVCKPHNIRLQISLVKGLALHLPTLRRVLGILEAINLRSCHRAPCSHEEEISAVDGA